MSVTINITNVSLIIPTTLLVLYMGIFGFRNVVTNFFSTILFFLGFLAIISIGWYYSWKNILSKVPVIREVCGLPNYSDQDEQKI